jgi:hypothetical protein
MQRHSRPSWRVRELEGWRILNQGHGGTRPLARSPSARASRASWCVSSAMARPSRRTLSCRWRNSALSMGRHWVGVMAAAPPGRQSRCAPRAALSRRGAVVSAGCLRESSVGRLNGCLPLLSHRDLYALRSAERTSTAFEIPTLPASTGGRTSTGTSGRSTAAAMNSGSMPGWTATRSRFSTIVRFTTTVSRMERRPGLLVELHELPSRPYLSRYQVQSSFRRDKQQKIL